MNTFICAVVLCALPALFEHGDASTTGDSARINLGQTNEGKIYVGTPPQARTVLFDTGSSDVFVMGFDKDKSSTYQEAPNNETKLNYGSGGTMTRTHTDTLKLGDTSSSIVINDQIFGVADKSIKVLEERGIYGIFGLAFPVLSKFHQTPVFLKLAEEGALKDNSFTFAKTRDVDTDRDENPLCRVGYLYFSNDLDWCEGDFTYLPVTEKKYWTAQAKEIHINDYSLCTDCKIVADTGSSNFLVPENLLQPIHDKIGATKNNKGQYQIDCDKMSQAPDLVVQLTEDFAITLKPEHYISKDDDECTSVISKAHVSHADFIVLGMAALDGHCVQFREDGRIGFSRVKEIPADDPSCPQDPEDEE